MSMIKTLDEMIAMEARVKELEAEINKKAEYNMEAFEQIAKLQAGIERLREAAMAVVDRGYVGIGPLDMEALEQAIKEVEGE